MGVFLALPNCTFEKISIEFSQYFNFVLSLSEYFSSTLTINFIQFFFNVENQVNLDEAYCASAGLSVDSCWSHGNLISLYIAKQQQCKPTVDSLPLLEISPEVNKIRKGPIDCPSFFMYF